MIVGNMMTEGEACEMVNALQFPEELPITAVSVTPTSVVSNTYNDFTVSITIGTYETCTGALCKWYIKLNSKVKYLSGCEPTCSHTGGTYSSSNYISFDAVAVAAGGSASFVFKNVVIDEEITTATDSESFQFATDVFIDDVNGGYLYKCIDGTCDSDVIDAQTNVVVTTRTALTVE